MKVTEAIHKPDSGSKLEEAKKASKSLIKTTGSSSPGMSSSSVSASTKKKKNVFGLDFEIPDELSQLIANEMKQQSEGTNN